MPKKRPSPTPAQPPDFCFVEQLRGEHPPSFPAMKALYQQALHLLALSPWELLSESQLIIVRPPNTEHDCYCSIMGAVGQVFSLCAYLGPEGYGAFRKISTGQPITTADFLAQVRSVYVDFVPNSELEAPDRALLNALGLTTKRGMLTPIFRAIRPGHHPWFITAEEAALLSLCLRAVTAICLQMINSAAPNYWSHPSFFPLVLTHEDPWRIQPLAPPEPEDPPLLPASLESPDLARLRRQDFPIRGIIELDYFPTMSSSGGRNERKACTAVALAVDAKTGFVFPPALTSPPDPAQSLLQAICRAITATRSVPSEIRLQSKSVKDCIAGLAEALSLPLLVVPRLPAFEEAREGLLEFMRR